MRFPIKIKISFLIILLIFETMVITHFFILGQEKSILTEEVQKRGEAMVHILAQDSKGPLLSDDDLLLQKFVTEMSKTEGVAFALICDEQGKVRAHNELTQLGMVLKDIRRDMVLQKNPLVIRRIEENGNPILVFEEPISYGGTPIGFARLGISVQLIDKTVLKAQGHILFIALLSLGLGIVGAIFLATVLSRPIHRLQEGVEAIGSGDLKYRADVTTSDELGELTHAFNIMAENLYKKKLIEEAFGRYVTKQVADEILAHPEEIHLGGKRQEVSVLFADIRGFTGLAERLEPEEVVYTVNEYLTLMTKIVFKYDGTLDKFLGDAIMAVFGAPVFFPDHSLRAISAAWDIQKEIETLNQRREARGAERVKIGIGINAGEVVTGNIGFEERMEYTVIGDNVNIAARLESLAEGGQILISPSIFEKVAHKVHLRPLHPIRLKGKANLLQVYEVLGWIEARANCNV